MDSGRVGKFSNNSFESSNSSPPPPPPPCRHHHHLLLLPTCCRSCRPSVRSRPLAGEQWPVDLKDDDERDGRQLTLTNVASAMAGVQQDPVSNPSELVVCYSPTMIGTSGLWLGDNPLDYSLPIIILQAMMAMATTRVLNIILRQFRQPRFVAEVVGGIILGPSVMGSIPGYMDMVFPTRSMAVLETMANLGLVYFIFLVGLQVDLSTVVRAGRRAWVLTGAGVVFPFIVECIFYIFFGEDISTKKYVDAYLVFVGVSISITAFPVLARILADLKLHHTENGKLAMSAAILNAGLAWILLALSVALNGKHRSMDASWKIVISGVAFVIVVYYTVRPAANWITSLIQEGEVLDEAYVVGILLVVMVYATVADAVGIHAVFGAFTVGVVIPKGPLVAILLEKVEDFVTGFLMPLFFLVVGIQTNIKSMRNVKIYGFLIGVVLLSGVAKVVTVVVVTMFFGMQLRDGFSLGILMNTKGLMELIVLHIALDKKVLYTQSYTTMVLMSVVMTALVTPLVMLVHRPPRQFVTYKRRTIQRGKPDAELRMLACVHNTRNVPSIVSLLDISNPTKRSPIFVYAAYLVELTGRESAMLIFPDAQKDSEKKQWRGGGGGGAQQGNLNFIQAQSDQINNAFQTYEQHAGGVSVQPLTVVSAYSSMHEDVCNLAEDKHAALLILPFHKQHTVDGGMEAINPGIRTLNQNVLVEAPCSVGILIDRGIGGASSISAGLHAVHHIAVLFIGGPDDREALAYAARMSDHPAISLTALRFVDANQEASSKAAAPPGGDLRDERVLDAMTEAERELLLDDESVKEFRIKTMTDESVVYMEKTVATGEEIVTAIRSIDNIHDLYLVGREAGLGSPLTEGMTDWAETPELGPIGDLLVSSDFTVTVSVLVIQQYRGVGTGAAPDSPVGWNVGHNKIGRWGP